MQVKNDINRVMCSYKYVLEMAPIHALYSTVMEKLRKKHKKDFLRKRMDFFISSFYWDDQYWYVQLALDFDGKHAFIECKKFLQKSELSPKNYICEITSEHGVHVMTRHAIPVPKEVDIKEYRKSIVYSIIDKGILIDKIASQNINPFRRFPSRSVDKKHWVYPLRGDHFLKKPNSILLKEFRTFQLTEKNYEKLLNVCYNIDIRDMSLY